MDFIELLKAIIIAIVEGITEFLPISSTGHMIIVSDIINFSGDFANLFMIVIQLGAILAVVVKYREKIINSIIAIKPKQNSSLKAWTQTSGFQFWLKIAIAFIPSGIFGFLFNDFIDAHLMIPFSVALSLIVGAFLMLGCEYKLRDKGTTTTIEDITIKQASIIGVFQILAVAWPGFSRSASTIIGGWVMGLNTYAAAEFSFFLAIPTMIMASGYSLLKFEGSLAFNEIIMLTVGFIVSFGVALVVINKFMTYLQTKPMKVFAIYRLIVGIILVVYFFVATML